MKDDRTFEQKYEEWLNVCRIAWSKGWVCEKGWVFRSPVKNLLFDLSAANLDMLDYIEKEESFLYEGEL